MNICVFLGSRTGNNPIYKDSLLKLGDLIVEYNHKLVFGGSKVGLMGELAMHVKENGGYIIGIEPEMYDNEDVALKDIDEYIVVKSMSERKDMLMEISDIFIMFPGGIGTLEEFSQIASMKNMGVSNKKVYVLNIEGYYDSLKQLLDTMTKNDFYSKESNTDILFINNVEDLKKYF